MKTAEKYKFCELLNSTLNLILWEVRHGACMLYLRVDRKYQLKGNEREFTITSDMVEVKKYAKTVHGMFQLHCALWLFIGVM